MIAFFSNQASAAIPPETVHKFALFGALHLTILVITVLLPAVLSLLTHRDRRPRVARAIAWVFAIVLVLDHVFSIVWGYHEGRISHWENALPMQLCDWAAIAVIFALVTQAQLPYELAYFWGLSGTVQALLTPDVGDPFPNPFFIAFFVSHCGIVISVLFMTWGLHRRPLPGAVWRSWLWSQVYLVTAGLVDWLGRADDVNFGYLAHKPRNTSSLLDLFGPWPWYILTLEAMTALFFLIFYLPFWIADRLRPKPAAAIPDAARALTPRDGP